MQNGKNMDQYTRMTETPVAPLLIRLAIPTTISMLVTSIYNMADAAFVGQLGNAASGAIGIVFGYMAILQAIGFIAAGIALVILMPGFAVETILAVILCLVFGTGTAFIALSRDVKKPKLDWVTEHEAVKQNYGVLFSMLISWAILIAVAGLCYFMITWEWSMEIIFAVLLVVLLGIAAVTYRHLMKNVDKYYCAG